MQGKPVAEQEIGKQLLIETVAYADLLCRRKLLLHYFGEQYTEDSCDHATTVSIPRSSLKAWRLSPL